MIPKLNTSGVLPPFTGPSPTIPAAVSPYVCTMSELHGQFGATTPRGALVRGLLDYRKALAGIGVSRGYQFIDGSFVEDCETVRGRPPNDVDVVTFAYLPVTTASQKLSFMAQHADLFKAKTLKDKYKCHAFFIDLGTAGHLLVGSACYWYGLLSHQRVSALWKGMLCLPLQSDDDTVKQSLSSQGVNVT